MRPKPADTEGGSVKPTAYGQFWQLAFTIPAMLGYGEHWQLSEEEAKSLGQATEGLIVNGIGKNSKTYKKIQKSLPIISFSAVFLSILGVKYAIYQQSRAASIAQVRASTNNERRDGSTNAESTSIPTWADYRPTR